MKIVYSLASSLVSLRQKRSPSVWLSLMFASRNVGRPNSSFFSFALCLLSLPFSFLLCQSRLCVSMKLPYGGPTSGTAVSHKSASSFNRYIDRASLCVSQCVPLTLTLFFLLSLHIPVIWVPLSPLFSLPCFHLTFLFSLFFFPYFDIWKCRTLLVSSVGRGQ